jgi:hypothetical protein
MALVELLWKETTVSQEWIADRLSMRSAANMSQQLRRLEREKTLRKVAPAMRRFLTVSGKKNRDLNLSRFAP